MGVPDSLRTALADRYRLERELGQGGMATVYLAEDLKHHRKVAIKVLRPELAAVIGAERFLREIQTIATLQHPHILGLIDSGEVNGTAYYVMPFVDGESLRDRLRREQQLPVGDAVRLATEVAAALDYAHRHGVIHRDIKPENILLHDGQALVADFGIALAVSSAGGGSRMTETGMSLGTPHYMSPEQAMGERTITGRCDVYALGAVTYEMLVGEPPFTGPTAQAIVAKVMTAEPAGLSAQRRSVPPAVEDAVLTALSKLPADRFATAAEFAAALNGHAVGSSVRPSSRPRAIAPVRRPWLVPLLGAVAALATAAAIVLGIRLARRPAAPVDRFSLDIPDLRVNFTGFYGISLAIAPDGSRMAFVTRSGETVTRLAVRDRGDLEARLLQGTEGGDAPFFSPDGRWLGFFAGARLYKVAVAGGTPVLLADKAQFALPSAVWLPDGRIVYAGPDFKMMAVDADGGNPVVLVPAPKTGGLGYPVALVNGALLVTRCGNTCAGPTIVAIDVKTQAEDTILVGATKAALLPDGTLIAVRSDGTMVAAPFDARRRRLTRPPTPVLSGIQVEIGVIPEFAVADDGTLVYLPSNAFAGVSTVAEVDRAGHARVLDPGWKGRFISANPSPDGQRIAVSTLEGAGSTLWVKQLDTGPLTRLTFTTGVTNYRGAWFPDGRTLSYSSDVKGSTHLYRIRADGSDKPERLFPADSAQIDEASWSSDGRWLAYRTGTVPGLRDVYLRRAAGDGPPIPVAAGQADEYMPAMSPDGRWVAYVSIESGREEVYVRPVPDVDRARWQVSSAGGTSPVWGSSSRELYYVTRGDTMVAATVGGTTEFQITAREPLFGTASFTFTPWHQGFGVRPGGRSFVMLRRTDESAGPEARRLAVVLNWFTDVRARLAKSE
jgi:eukaryotic-like serine/threonine-protein kinase